MTPVGPTRDRPSLAERFEVFVREYQDMVFATAVRLLGRESDAEDVAQTVFLKAYERFGDLEKTPAVAGWLKTVTQNLCLNHLSRYRARWQFFSELEGDATSPAQMHEPADAQPSVLSVLEETERASRLEAALRALPDHQRVPLALFHFEEMGYQDIASALGVSVAKVKSDIHRGRERLKKDLMVLHGSR